MKFSKKLLSLLLTTVFIASSVAFIKMEATSWNVDRAHSSINFEVRHFFTNVPGVFNEYDATVNFSPDNLEESSISVSIQINSVDTKNDRRNGHLKTPDFFDAETYPTMDFTSSKIEALGDNNFVAHGTLTIKDVSKDFELPFTLLGIKDNPFRENMLVAGISSEFTLMRNEFGVGTGDWVSDAVVGNDVDVTLNLELSAPE